MKHKLLLIAAVIIGATFAMPAHAVLIGSATQEEVAKYLNGQERIGELMILNGTVLASTGISGTENAGAFKIGSTFYSTNHTGLVSATVAKTTPKTIVKGSKLYVMAKGSTMIMVSNKKTGGKSFMYDTKAKKALTISPTIRAITSGTFSTSNNVVAMIAKNGNGKSKIFLNQNGSFVKFKEFALPKYATRCDTIALSTSGKQIFIGCKFNVPKQASGQYGYVLMTVKNGAFGTARRTILGAINITNARWISSSYLATIEYDTTQEIYTMTGRVISNAKVASTTALGASSVQNSDGTEVDCTPWEILPGGNSTLIYSYLLYVPSSSYYATAIYQYSPTANTNEILLNDGTYKGLEEAL